MIDILLAQVPRRPAPGLNTIGPFVLMLLVWGLLFFGAIWLIRYLMRSAKEHRRLRLEVGKLAEEIHRLRQDALPQNDGEDNIR